MKKILFTGGGTAGHVTLNLNLIPIFQKNGWQVVYIGSSKGIERELVSSISGVRYYSIKTGKLRRYFSWQNFVDAIKVPLGIIQAFYIIRKEKPDIIYSKGGFVSFPVVVGGYLNRRKIFMHESDVTPGLANMMSLPFVTKFFTTFTATAQNVKAKYKSKIKYIGPVLSDRLNNGVKAKALGLCHFIEDKPVVLFVGGSLGARSINTAVATNLPTLLEKYHVIHICGKGQSNDIKMRGYAQFEFVDTEYKDLLALANIVVSRSGSNAIFELWSLKKPMLLIPLSSASSRGEQSLNAKAFQDLGFAEVMQDEDISDSAKFLEMIDKVYEHRDIYKQNMQNINLKFTNNEDLFQEVIND